MPKIHDIESFVVPYTEPNDHGSTRYVCLVKVTASDGTIGWGEAVTLFREATIATDSLVNAYRLKLIGVDADPATVATLLTDESWWYGDAGIACFARAAIDIALWDVLGVSAGMSLSGIIGTVQEKLPVVISCHAVDSDIPSMTERLAGHVTRTQANGIKVGFGKRGDAHLGFEHDRDVEFVRSLRRALGDEPEIMIDIGAKIRWSTDDAIRRIRAFEEFGIRWTEEPLGANDPEGYRVLKDSVSSLIAYGEREWSPSGYRNIIASGTVDVVGVDPGRACGITGFLATSRLLESGGVQGNAHAFAGPLVFAASLALSLESTAYRQLELMPYRNTLYDLVEGCPQPDAGAVTEHGGAGLGVTVLEDRVRAVAE